MRAVFGYGFIVKDKKYDLDNHLGTLCTVVPLIDGTELVCVSDSMAITGRGSARNGEARANYWFNGNRRPVEPAGFYEWPMFLDWAKDRVCGHIVDFEGWHLALAVDQD